MLRATRPGPVISATSAASWESFWRSGRRRLNSRYLPDVAKLEWAMDSVFHAADAVPLDLQALAAVPPEVFATLRFDLHPASRIVCSPYPILRIWR